MAQNQNANAPQTYTVSDAMVSCGINNTDQYQGETLAQRFATDILSDSFAMCMDKTMDEVNTDIKQYSTLTQNQGQIRITPGTAKPIKLKNP